MLNLSVLKDMLKKSKNINKSIDENLLLKILINRLAFKFNKKNLSILLVENYKKKLKKVYLIALKEFIKF